MSSYGTNRLRWIWSAVSAVDYKVRRTLAHIAVMVQAADVKDIGRRTGHADGAVPWPGAGPVFQLPAPAAVAAQGDRRVRRRKGHLRSVRPLHPGVVGWWGRRLMVERRLRLIEDKTRQNA